MAAGKRWESWPGPERKTVNEIRHYVGVVPGQYQRAISRFLETGALPPAEVKNVGRYYGLEGSSSGFIVAETQ